MRLAVISAALLIAGAAHAQSADDSQWAFLVSNVFDDRPIEDGAGVIGLETPYRAEDAAIVPITIRNELPADSDLRVEKITLIIDNNPAPVAAEFKFGSDRRVGEISTRVRVDAYTDVRAVAELSDGKLYAVNNFVKASGGCSAPAIKDPNAVANLGEMRMRAFDNATARDEGLVDAQLMIRHPNNSGLQRDPLMNYFIPAYFVRDVSVKVDDELLLRMEGGISISENPTFRFTYEGSGAETVAVEAIDTKEKLFENSWPGLGSAS